MSRSRAWQRVCRPALPVALALVVAACATPSPRPSPSPAPTATPTPTATSTPVPSATCGASLQAKVDGTPSGGTLNLTGCSYGTGATISRPLTLLGATVRPAAGTTGIVVKASDVTLDGLRILGPQGSVYREGEFGITTSASASAPVRRLTIRNSEIASFGKAGMWLRYVADLVIEGNDVHDAVYAGIMIISGTGGRIAGNTVSRIGVTGASANGNNAYGIALEDQGLPVSSDLVVADNVVTDVPTWHALDTHGGHRITFSGNTVSGSPRALFITNSGASGSQATDIVVTGNEFIAPEPAGDNAVAVTTYAAENVTVTGNVATGWGRADILYDFQGRSTGIVVSDNSVSG